MPVRNSVAHRSMSFIGLSLHVASSVLSAGRPNCFDSGLAATKAALLCFSAAGPGASMTRIHIPASPAGATSVHAAFPGLPAPLPARSRGRASPESDADGFHSAPASRGRSRC